MSGGIGVRTGARYASPVIRAEAVRVVIIDGDTSQRESLAILIDGCAGYECVGAYGSVELALARRPDTEPDVILVDLDSAGVSDLDGLRQLRNDYPGAAVVVLTAFENQDIVLESFHNGAVGYLLKKTAPARILEAIQEAGSGGAPMSLEIAVKVVHSLRKPLLPPAEGLTPREVRVLELLADGFSYESPALHLGVSVNTVRNYVRSIYSKLQVHSKSEAVSRALRSGLI